jgi:putative thioredoxin
LVLAANGRFEESLDQLVQIVEADRTFGSEHAKAPMVQIFAILGPQHPASMTYRSRLASALY